MLVTVDVVCRNSVHLPVNLGYHDGLRDIALVLGSAGARLGRLDVNNDMLRLSARRQWFVFQ